MTHYKPRIGWIGLGRMGTPMAELIVKAGHDLTIWNRTRAKAEPLQAKGAKLVASPLELGGMDIVFTMVSTGKDVEAVLCGDGGVTRSPNSTVPKLFIDCSSISVDESARIRSRLADVGAQFLAVPVSGNGKCVKAGKLSAVASGPRAAFDRAQPIIATYARAGVCYVGEGELARICKIAHNVMLGVVIQNLAEITILAQKHGVPRHAFLDFMNNSVMGSTFTRYKSHAVVNLDWTTTFTPELLRKDLDLGLEAARRLGVPMPVTAATREAVQAHFGAATLKANPDAYLAGDFAAIVETVALSAGTKLVSEDVHVPTGLEVEPKKH